MSINCFTCSGRVSRAGILRQTVSGRPLVKFGFVSWSRRMNRLTGEYEDFPNFFDCTMFGEKARYWAPRLVKGSQFVLQGRMQYDKWKDDKNRDRSKLELIVTAIDDGMPKRPGGAEPPLSASEPYRR